MIGRNDPCTCDSGKKYKKCCGSKGADLVELIVNEELDRILTGYFNEYPKGSDRDKMMRIMREWQNQLSDSWDKEHIEEASSEFFLFIQQPEIWQTYLAQQLAQIERESVRVVLRAWHQPFMLLAEISGVQKDYIEVRELFSDAEYHVTRNEGMPADIGTLLFGVVLLDPRKDELAIAPVSSMMFLAKWSKQTKKSVVELREAASDLPIEEFMVQHSLAIYELFIKRSLATMNELVEEVVSPSQLHALSALDLLLRELDQSTDRREILHKLTVAYFLNENKEISAEGDFLAAVLKTGMDIGVIQGLEMTENEIFENYAESNKKALTYAAELAGLYKEMMSSEDAPMAARLYDIGTDPRPTEKALWETSMTTGGVVQPERKPTRAESRAQLLAFEAYLAETEEARRKLTNSAAELSTDCADVSLLKAETEQDPEKAGKYYEEAIRLASRVFEPGENPWQNIPNRPFMRAAFAYGVHLFTHKEYDEAASLFLDLLKMNQTDNQGARYEAVASLIHAGRFNEAAEILVRYEKGSEHDATYHYLDWKLEHTASSGQSKDADDMLQAAAKLNSHVIHLKTFKAKSIEYPRYQSIQPGSVEEARYIWLLVNDGR